MKLITFLGLVSAVLASDRPCTSEGGKCQDYRYQVCPAGYARGKCDGDVNRRCCLECDSVCEAIEASYSRYDGNCNNAGGQCRVNSNYCDGLYASGKCGGPSRRQCCQPVGNGDKYGDIMECDTTGASSETAKQDKLAYFGVPASHKMASNDKSRMDLYKPLIVKAATDTGMDAAVIAGIISRETRAGAVLQPNGFGFDGHGFGLMQVDDRYHVLKGTKYSLEHIKQGAGILAGFIVDIKRKHPTWNNNMALKGGISAYNAGVKNVRTYQGMDIGTTGNDYANDVVARSQWYKNNGY